MGIYAADCAACKKPFMWYSGSPFGQLCDSCIPKQAGQDNMVQHEKAYSFTVKAELTWEIVEYEQEDYYPYNNKKEPKRTTGTLTRSGISVCGSHEDAHEYGQKLVDNLLEEAHLTGLPVKVTSVSVTKEG